MGGFRIRADRTPREMFFACDAPSSLRTQGAQWRMYNSTGILYEESEGGVHSYCNTFGRWYNGSFCLRDWMYSADAGYIGPDHYPSLWQGSYDPRPR